MRKSFEKEIVHQILQKIPRPNIDELPELYKDLDEMVKRIAEVLFQTNLASTESLMLEFDKASEDKIRKAIKRNPEVMIPFFLKICGYSVREMERLHNIRSVYSIPPSDFGKLARVIKEHLRHPLSIETVLFKFYKNWEEHQKRHYRARKVEEKVVKFLRDHGYDAGKLKIECMGKEREIDCAVPPDPERVRIAIQIRYGVRRDVVKRVKEFSTEFDEISGCKPEAKFVVIYWTSSHEKSHRDEIRKEIEKEREGKKPFDFVMVISREKDLDELLEKFKEWGVPKS